MRFYSMIITINSDILCFHKYIRIEEILSDDIKKHYMGHLINNYENKIRYYFDNVPQDIRNRIISKIKNLNYLTYHSEEINPDNLTYNIFEFIAILSFFMLILWLNNYLS